MKTKLTKSLIKNSTDCQRKLYLEINSPALKSGTVDSFLTHLANEGYKFEDIALSLLPESEQQKEFTSNNVKIRVDAIDENLTEVKSSTKVTDEHVLDVAIQAHILAELNILPEKHLLAFVNRDYIRANDLNITKLVKIEDISESVKELLPEVKELVETARKTALLKRSPKKEQGRHCLTCPFIESCSPKLLNYTIFNLRGGGKKIDELFEAGVFYLKDIPSFTKLSPYQKLQVKAEQAQSDIVASEKINKIINTLKYPICFLDFEAAPILAPRYMGCRPYEQLTFQVSIHIQDAPESDFRHVEFLHDKDSDPRYDLARFLNSNVGENGSVVVYHASYEKGRLQELAEKYPRFAYKMETIIDRLWDLETIFTKGHYLSSKFDGSTSIKKVLPALVPKLTYKDLNIQNGADAFIQYLQMIDDNTTSGMKREIYNSLLQYCKMDTFAMYAILEALREVCHE